MGGGRRFDASPTYCLFVITCFISLFRLILPNKSLYKSYSKPFYYEKIDNDGVSNYVGDLIDSTGGR